MIMFIYLYSLIEVLVVLVPILLSVAFMTVIERKVMAAMQRRVGPNMVGFYGILQPFADALKLVVKETIVPNHANRVLLFLAPIVTLTFSLLGWVVMPLGQGLCLADLSLGILYSIALSSVGILGILFAGWSSNSKYAFMGGLRSTSQIISYELILTSVILIVILITGTFSYTNIIQHQQSVWFVLPLFPLFIVWFFSALAETNRLVSIETYEVNRKTLYVFSTGLYFALCLIKYFVTLYVIFALAHATGSDIWSFFPISVLGLTLFKWTKHVLGAPRDGYIVSKAKKIELGNDITLYEFFVIVGLLLSDIFVGPGTPKGMSRLTINVSLNVKPYFHFVISILGKYCTPYARNNPYVQHTRTGSIIRYVSICMPIFNIFRELFYNQNGKKVIKIWLVPVMNVVVFAFWVMGDGAWHANRLRLHTEGYDLFSIFVLHFSIFVAFGIVGQIYRIKSHNSQYLLILRAEDVDKIRDCVKKHMHPSIYYKIDKRVRKNGKYHSLLHTRQKGHFMCWYGAIYFYHARIIKIKPALFLGKRI